MYRGLRHAARSALLFLLTNESVYTARSPGPLSCARPSANLRPSSFKERRVLYAHPTKDDAEPCNSVIYSRASINTTKEEELLLTIQASFAREFPTAECTNVLLEPYC